MSRLLYGAPPQSLFSNGSTRLPRDLAKGSFLVTFDDGPGPQSLELARQVESAGGRALFFLSTSRLDPDAVPASELALAESRARELKERGHVIGSHGLYHVHLGRLSAERVTHELSNSKRILADLLGAPPLWFRPPFGSWRPGLDEVAAAQDLRLLFWSCNPKDWAARNPECIVSRANRVLREGDVLLLHCTGKGQNYTVQVLPRLLELVSHRGLHPMDARELATD